MIFIKVIKKCFLYTLGLPFFVRKNWLDILDINNDIKHLEKIADKSLTAKELLQLANKLHIK